MKKLYIILTVVLLICVIGSVVLLILSPDRVPLHYNFAGEVDRIGSKYVNLLWPLLCLALGALFLLEGRAERKKQENSNEKLLLIVGIFTVGFLTLLGFFLMGKTLRYDGGAGWQLSVDSVFRFENIGFGTLLAVLGNFLPKARRNSLIGLRTKWSLANDRVWQKSQRFGGFALVIAGLLLIVLSLFLPGMWNLALLLATLPVLAVLCVLQSRRYYLQDQKGEEPK